MYNEFERYNLEQQPLTHEYMIKYIEHYIKISKLGNYIEHIYFDDKINASGSYKYNNKSITINDKLILNIVLDALKVNAYTAIYDDFCKMNMMLLNTINHEITHAEQYKYIENNNNVIAEILIESILLATNNKPLYKKYHDLFTVEHHAIITAILMDYNFIKKNINKNLERFLEIKLRRFILKQYFLEKDFKSPYNFLQEKIGKDCDNKIILLPNEELIKYGLDINEEDLNKQLHFRKV